MASPIDVLKGNILHSFEATAKKLLEQAVASRKVSGAILYDDSKEKVMMPHANIESRDIYLQETYLAYLWALIYSVFVMYEEGVQRPLINNAFKGGINQSDTLLFRARELYEWAISLVGAYSPWDERLPNPRSHNHPKEKYFAEKVNNLFQKAVSYNLHHELAHLTLGHDSYFDGSSVHELSETEKADRIQIENEADKFAFDNLINIFSEDKSKLPIGVAITMTNVASILVVNHPGQVRLTTHPDLDDRLHRVFVSLGLEQEAGQFYCWYLGCLALRLFFMKHGLDEPTKDYETAQDAFESYLQALDRIKSGDRA